MHYAPWLLTRLKTCLGICHYDMSNLLLKLCLNRLNLTGDYRALSAAYGAVRARVHSLSELARGF